MWNIFKGALMVLSRKRELFIWALAFPLVLATMFMALFTNLDNTAATFEPVPTAVVTDEPYTTSKFADVISKLGTKDADQLLDVRTFDTVDAARAALAEGSVDGVFTVDAAGTPKLTVAPLSSSLSMKHLGRTILDTLATTYLRNADLLQAIARDNPAALADPTRVAQALFRADATVQVSLTHAQPAQSVRYYYALLGMAALISGHIGLMALCGAQPNLSALAARRSVGATSRSKTLTGTLAASWLISFICLVVAFAYMRFVVGIDFEGREGLCVAALAVAALFSTSLGTLVGALPKVGLGVKVGLITGMTCLSSMLAGLYGEPSMKLADTITRELPVLAALNPAKVVMDIFYSLYYYDSLVPFTQKAGVLLLMTAVLFAASALFVRRQRYASL